MSRVRSGVPAPEGATLLPGPVLPGMVNAHSHAFQRAFAGLAERRDAASDDFWGWRERMYRVAGQISPDDLQAIAAQLYTELLRGGYTQLCEFHYLQHQEDGSAYPAVLFTTGMNDNRVAPWISFKTYARMAAATASALTSIISLLLFWFAAILSPRA